MHVFLYNENEQPVKHNYCFSFLKENIFYIICYDMIIFDHI